MNRKLAVRLCQGVVVVSCIASWAGYFFGSGGTYVHWYIAVVYTIFGIGALWMIQEQEDTA